MTPLPPGSGVVDPEAIKTLMNAFYPALLAEPSTVRTRAQSAYTVASAIAAGLVTAGAAGGIAHAAGYVQLTGVAAVGGWLITAALFINISRGVTTPPHKSGMLRAEEFVTEALRLTLNETKTLESRLTLASRATFSSLGLTAAALFLALFVSPPAAEQTHVTLFLSPAGQKTLHAACESLDSSVTGEVNLTSLGDAYVTVSNVKECTAQDDATLGIPGKEIRGYSRLP